MLPNERRVAGAIDKGKNTTSLWFENIPQPRSSHNAEKIFFASNACRGETTGTGEHRHERQQIETEENIPVASNGECVI